VIALVIVSVFFMVSSIVVMVPVIVIVLVKVWAGVMVVVVFMVVVAVVRLGVRIWFRTGRRRLRSGRWAGVRLRGRGDARKQRKAATAARFARNRQGEGEAGLDVRATGGQGQEQEKVFHRRASSMASASRYA
jgi:hypothetical protein